MSAFIGLIRAELLQHRGGMILTPLVIAGLIGIFFMAQLIFYVDGVDIDFGKFGFELDNDTILSEDGAKVGENVAAAFGFIGIPIFLVANIVAFFVMLSALYEERQERTILFFKSMPVSDIQSVLAKYVTASFIGPFIAILVMIALSGILSLATAAVFSLRGVSDVWSYLGHLPLLKLLFSFLGYYTLYALMVAPVFAYLLMMSALAPRSPFLMAVLPIAVIGIAEAILSGSAFVLREIGIRVTGVRLMDVLEGARPNSGVVPDGFDAFFIRFNDIFSALTAPSLWIGLLVAAAFLSVAIRARSRKTL